MTSIAKIGTSSFDTMAAAAAAIANGQTLNVLRSGKAGDVPATFNKTGNFKILGVSDAKGGMPKLLIDLYTRPAGGKGIINIEAGNHEIAYLHLEGCAVPEDNGAGVRFNNNAADSNLFLHHMRLTGNQDGILTGGGTLTLRMEDMVLQKNGLAMAKDRQGQSHNAYIGAMAKFTATRVSFLDSVYGHDFKSRAKITELTQVLCEGSAHGRAMDIPNGGIVRATDCKFSKDASAEQNNLIDIGAEGITDGRPEEYIYTNCHFHNDVGILRDVEYIRNRSNVEVVLVDPLFTGAAAAKGQVHTLKGKVRIVLTGGPLGPRVPVGGDPGVTSEAPIPEAGAATTPTPTTTAPASSFSIIPDPGTGTWSKLADEGATVTVADNTVVRYGAAGKYIYAKVSGQFKALSATFGSDPIRGTVKTVEQFTPAATPTPQQPGSATGSNDQADALSAALSALTGRNVTVTID